MGQIKHYVVS